MTAVRPEKYSGEMESYIHGSIQYASAHDLTEYATRAIGGQTIALHTQKIGY